ncbi:MAG: hypothetical protein BYD32DRAFT_440580 [Podila humilis]|nr:MAG: hypothetical protein BYD32DRAFT_440580 [Podila humilis]
MAHTPSPSPPPPPSPPHPQPQATISSSSSRSSSPLSLKKPSLNNADIQEAEQYTQDDKKKKKQRWFYGFVGLRIFFGLGLAALALYWPASGRKPPMGYLPRDTWQHKEKPAWIGRGRPPLLSPTLVTPSSTILPSPTVSPTTLMINSANTYSSRSISTDPDQEPKSLAAARTNRSHGQGNNNNRNATAHWCSVEESYGDNQSALVYCQVNHIRPAMVYFWVSLVLFEIGMAYMAGELTKKDKSTPDQLSLDPEKRDYRSSGYVHDSGAGVGRPDANHATGAMT